jgi:hypothetical protein
MFCLDTQEATGLTNPGTRGRGGGGVRRRARELKAGARGAGGETASFYFCLPKAKPRAMPLVPSTSS